jgi:hypothetical protein
MISVSYMLNKYVAPFVMGFATAGFSVATGALPIVLLFAVVIVSGLFSLPNGDRMIERCFDAVL